MTAGRGSFRRDNAMLPIHDENPTRVIPWVTYGLIAANVAVFTGQLALGPEGEAIIRALGFTPAALFGGAGPAEGPFTVPPVVTLVSALFLHAGILHLAGNLLYLWVFGNNVEDAMGRGRFILFFLASGIAAALFQGLVEPQSLVPMVGASGAVSGVLAGYLLFYPFARVLVVIPIGFILYPARLSAFWVLGAWFLIQAAAALLSDPGTPGIAWWAHFGGFLAGLALAPLLRRRDVPLFGDVRVIAKGPWARALSEARDLPRPPR